MESSSLGGSGAILGWEEKDEHMGMGFCCISEHGDQKSIEKKEQAGREENMGI
jgi:hypothetical protein